MLGWLIGALFRPWTTSVVDHVVIQKKCHIMRESPSAMHGAKTPLSHQPAAKHNGCCDHGSGVCALQCTELHFWMCRSSCQGMVTPVAQSRLCFAISTNAMSKAASMSSPHQAQTPYMLSLLHVSVAL
ncbi:TPA: hypothetical protein ACH3X1_015951 [Trebouxia sp. C0004]